MNFHQIYIFTHRKSGDKELEIVRATLQSIPGNFVIAPATAGDAIPYHKDQWIIIELRADEDVDGFANYTIDELYGAVGKITVVSRVIPKLLVGIVDQVGTLLSLPQKYYFVS